jgi:light-independent protochlorophyllide reductase subunit B
MMGLEEHLLAMFREDFEFHDEAAPSHLGTTTAPRGQERAAAAAPPAPPPPAAAGAPALVNGASVGWSADAEKELHKIPFFVRGKARRNTERFAQEHGVSVITIETLYDAKSHFGR